MKKVCHMTSAHARYDVRIFEKECVSLTKCGYEVYLIVNDTKENEIINGVHIISTGFLPKNRLQRMIYSTKKIYRKALEIDADIYHFHDPELLSKGYKLKRKKKKVFFDSHENVSDQIMDKTWIPKLLRKAVSLSYAWYEKKILKKLDAVIAVSPQFVEYFNEFCNRTILITNYPIIDENNEFDKQTVNNINITFAGGITQQWYHDNIIKAISDINGVRYLLAGNADQAYLDYLKTLPGWDKVDYLGQVPHSKVKELYAKSTLGIALNYANQVKEIGTLGNTKLFEFMEARLPVICTDYLLWKDIINKYKCGLCVNPLDINQIKEAMHFLINNQEEAKIMGENGRKAVEEHYNWNIEEKKLADLYKDFLN